MKEFIPTEQAIKKGREMVSGPAQAIFVIPTFFWFGIAIVGGFPFWVFPAELVLALSVSRLYRSVMITRWRLWAFENVRDVHQLKNRAIEDKLIGRDGSFFERIEIRTALQKEKWLQLQSRFTTPEPFVDDPTVPAEVLIYYKESNNFFAAIIHFWCIGFGLYEIIISRNFVYGTILLLTGLWMYYQRHKIRTDIRPQIIVNEMGVTTIQKGFHPWGVARNIRVITEAYARGASSYYLVYDWPGGKERLCIDNLTTDEKTLNNLLEVYKARWIQKQKQLLQ